MISFLKVKLFLSASFILLFVLPCNSSTKEKKSFLLDEDFTFADFDNLLVSTNSEESKADPIPSKDPSPKLSDWDDLFEGSGDDSGDGSGEGSGEYSEIGDCEGSGFFTCDDGATCLDTTHLCDGIFHCSDDSDEADCAAHIQGCLHNQWQCSDGHCVNLSERCNGFYTCPDGSDEKSCEDFICPEDFFKCNDGICIPEVLRCDKHLYCRDGSDEWGCTNRGCTYNEWQCTDGRCIVLEERCDGHRTCEDYSDEINCQGHTCLEGYFKCADGICIPGYLRCDQHRFCRDGSDEWGCSVIEGPAPLISTTTKSPNHDVVISLFTIPDFQVIGEGHQVVFRCRDEGRSRVNVHWVRDGYHRLPLSSTDYMGRLTIENIQLSDAGVYICEAEGVHPSVHGRQKAVKLQVDRYTSPGAIVTVCGLGYATCTSGHCIPKILVCNGVNDCPDGSDEDRCSTPYCEPNEFRCDNRKCAPLSWICDAQDDCGDGSDERGCNTFNPNTYCNMNEFACASGNMCIPKALMCDNTFDCRDGSDEFGCTIPIIVEMPTCAIYVRLRETFILSCRAVGFPTPTIAWRHNWGNLPSSCFSNSTDGYGTLTCTDAQRSHQGAFSCEALNYLGSTFAQRDTLVLIDPTTREAISKMESLCY